jgi:hypothetical protein
MVMGQTAPAVQNFLRVDGVRENYSDFELSSAVDVYSS